MGQPHLYMALSKREDGFQKHVNQVEAREHAVSGTQSDA